MIKKQLTWAILALVFSIASAVAANLSTAKRAGYVGERINGYVGIVSAATPVDVRELVSSVNQKRLAIYSKMAGERKVQLSQIEQVAGQRNTKKTVSGNYIQDSGGNWIKKQ